MKILNTFIPDTFNLYVKQYNSQNKTGLKKNFSYYVLMLILIFKNNYILA